MIYVHKDDFNGIVLVNDGSRGVIVHLVSFVSMMVPNHENILEEHIAQRVEITYGATVRDSAGVLKTNFKAELKEAILSCEREMIKLQQNRQYIDGALRDYVKPIEE